MGGAGHCGERGRRKGDAALRLRAEKWRGGECLLALSPFGEKKKQGGPVPHTHTLSTRVCTHGPRPALSRSLHSAQRARACRGRALQENDWTSLSSFTKKADGACVGERARARPPGGRPRPHGLAEVVRPVVAPPFARRENGSRRAVRILSPHTAPARSRSSDLAPLDLSPPPPLSLPLPPPLQIRFVLLISRQGKVRLAKWYLPLPLKEKAKVREERGGEVERDNPRASHGALKTSPPQKKNVTPLAHSSSAS